MSDEDFIDLVEFLMYSSDAFEDDQLLDEELDFENWEDKAEKFYNANKKENPHLKLLKDDDDIPF